ncbi:ABC transporter ATP-binding protein [Virgibacillus halophilus]
MNPLVKINQLQLQFENHTNHKTLSNISFEVAHGETLLLLGPSGSGKSTLTLCLNGLFPRELDGQMAGEILFDGKHAAAFFPGELSQLVGVVFQDPETQFCMMQVDDEIAFGLENIGTPPAEIGQKIDHALALVDMSAYKTSTIASLSGGQKQKLALACILAMEPALLVLDEPTANLDPVATNEVLQIIKKLQQKTNCSLIVIEHHLDGWTDIASRCVLLNKSGTIFFDGNLKDAVLTHHRQLKEEGIWLPKITQYFIQHAQEHLDCLPFTLEDFAAQAAPIQLPLPEINMVQHHMASEVLLSAKDLSWSVKQKQIVQHASLSIREGEFIAVIGANGSGKTSLSRIIAGIQKPSSGEIFVGGKALKNWKTTNLREHIGYVFQNPEHQFIAATVFEEVAFSLRLRELQETEIVKKVRTMLDICGLSAYQNEHPFRLSQGQKRRLSVATMLVDDQRMLILDEPTFGQDAHSNQELMRLLYERYLENTAIVMITHDMELVAQYATRVIVMQDGKIAADCTPDTLWKKYAGNLQEWHLSTPVSLKLQQLQERKYDYVPTSS